MCTNPLMYTRITLRTHDMYICFISLYMHGCIDNCIHICIYTFHVVYSVYIFQTHMSTRTYFHVYTETTNLKYGVKIDLLHHTIVRVRICILTHIWTGCTISVALIVKCTLFCSIISVSSVQVWMKCTLKLHFYISVQPWIL